MTFAGMYERNIDYVESDHVEPWQCEFNIMNDGADYYVLTLDGGVCSELFKAGDIQYPVLFTPEGKTPSGVKVIANENDIKVKCTDRYFTRAHLITFDSTDGATAAEMRSIIVDASKLTELCIVADGTMISGLTVSVDIVGGELNITLSSPNSGSSVYVYYIDVGGVRYYGKVNCTLESDVIHMDRFVEMYRYIV